MRKNNKINLTIGADPEVFFHDYEEFVPASKFINGTKENPTYLDDKGSAVLNDNVMAEFNIIPAKTKEEFIQNIEYVLAILNHIAEANNAKLVIAPSASFSKAMIDAYKERFEEFGCSPDECIYGEAERIVLNSNIRFAGGHVHIGYDKNKYYNIERRIVEVLDYLLAIPFVVIDNDNLRRKFYGKAGKFRITSYGVEYRSISNFWLSNQKLMEFVFEQTQKAVEMVVQGADSVFDDENIEKIINNSDYENALKICSKYNIKLPIEEYETTTIE